MTLKLNCSVSRRLPLVRVLITAAYYAQSTVTEGGQSSHRTFLNFGYGNPSIFYYYEDIKTGTSIGMLSVLEQQKQQMVRKRAK